MKYRLQRSSSFGLWHLKHYDIVKDKWMWADDFYADTLEEAKKYAKLRIDWYANKDKEEEL